jgi:YbgC/YbaW family acyl-CoA thioester hydrolase
MSNRAGGGFRYVRRVQFHETDQAGVAHFSSFFKYMEEAEHALWRAAGLRIDRAGADTGWPRVAASCDYKKPLFFEDEFDVIVRVQEVTRRTIQYGFLLERGEETIAVGSITIASVSRKPGSFKSIEVPPDIAGKLRAAAGQE